MSAAEITSQPATAMRTVGALLIAAALSGTSAYAQTASDPYRPHADWRTLETERFTVHYPSAAQAWTHRLASRMDAMGAAVAELVGNEPGRRVTVVVADPYNTTNGFAVSMLDYPYTVLWTTPPEPRAGIGEHREWGELLFVHEFAHLAHLTWESRNPDLRLRARLHPVPRGPVNTGTPRWVREGYATFVEGRITGHGRPHGVTRPAFLRLRALEGRLPNYAGLNAGAGYQDAAAAYLVGSAFLEWLEERRGEGALRDVWLRMSARERRGFVPAFSGVFGGPPDELYGLFTVDLTERALAARDGINAAGGVVEGELFQARRWHTGDPVVSPDGEWLALELYERDLPGRLVVWKTTPEPVDTARRREAREQAAARDPLDVPAVQWQPRPQRAHATLRALHGRGHRNPRWLPDNVHLLVVRTEPLGDGTLRPDLFVWNRETGALRRVTRGAGIRDADPSPDGTRAAGVRCAWGVCDIVDIELATGALRVLAAGSTDVVYYRPRYAPDGATIVTARQERGVWRLVAIPARGGEPRFLLPDDGVSRYDAAFVDDSTLVAVTTEGGSANLERIDLSTGARRTLTRTLGAVAAPAPNPADGSVFFLSLHSRGWDVRRLHLDSVHIERTTTFAAPLWPLAAAMPSVVPDTFAAGDVPPSRPYGLGPRRYRVLPGGYFGEDGGAVHVMLAGTDPLGRLSGNVQLAYGGATAWRGGSAALLLRRFRPHLGGSAFWAEQRPVAPGIGGTGGSVAYRGGVLGLEAERELAPARLHARVAASAGRLEGAAFDDAQRMLGLADFAATTFRLRGRHRYTFRLDAHAAAGETAGEPWQRVVVGSRATGRVLRPTLDAHVQYGWLSADAPSFERFTLGGSAPLLFDRALLRQQIALPGLPVGLVTAPEVVQGHVTLATGGFRPYFWFATMGDLFREWHRVVALQQTFTSGNNYLLAFPPIDITIGVSHSLDEPFANRTRAYVTVGYRP
jgi:Tol biopolymer transport system component